MLFYFLLQPPIPIPSLLRASPLDALSLDVSLCSLLTHQLSNIIGTAKQEIEFTMESAILYCALSSPIQATPGMKLQNLRYVSNGVNINRRQAVSLWLLSPVLSYVWKKLGNAILHSGEGVLSIWYRRIDLLSSALSLLNFWLFVMRGRHRCVMERILNVQITQAQLQINKQITFEFMNQQIAWRAMAVRGRRIGNCNMMCDE